MADDGPAPPEMNGLPWLGHAPRFLLDPLGLLAAARERHGDVVRISLGRFGSFYVVYHPDDAKQVMAEGRRVHRALMRELIGSGLLVAQTDDEWRRRRTALQPAFQRGPVTRMMERSRVKIEAAVEARWRQLARSGELFDMAAEMKQITLAVVLDAMMGPRVGGDPALAEALGRVIDYLDGQLFDRVSAPRSWPTPGNRRFREAMAALRGAIRTAIAASRGGSGSGGGGGSGGSGGGDDLVSLFVAARDPAGQPLTDEVLEQEILSTFVAGTETTGSALTWSWYFLGRDPKIEAAARASLARFGGKTPQIAELGEAAYIRWVLLEAMRLRPPAWALIRQFDAPVRMGRFTLPANAFVWATPWVTHRHPAFWPDAERFDPGRFEDSAAAGRHGFAYFPFGGGPHRCIGSEFALMESQLIMCAILQRFRLEMPAGQRIALRPRIALAPGPSPRFRVRAV